MNLKQLMYFLVLAEELHFGRAAKRLFMAQPPLSRQIQQLEKALGTQLLLRTNRSVSLTPAGVFLQEEGRRIIEQLSRTQRQLMRMGSGTQGQLRVGYVGAVMYSLLPRLLGRLKTALPLVTTLLSELPNQAQLDGLRQGRLDIGLVRGPLEAEGLAGIPLLSEAFSLVLAADYPRPACRVELRDLADQPFIHFARECAPVMVDTIFALCRQAGFSPVRTHETSQINTILRLVECGLGYSIVPAGVKEGCGLRLYFQDLADCPARSEVLLLYNPAAVSPLVANVTTLCREFAGELAGGRLSELGPAVREDEV